jgi:hypothetical protein
MLREKLIKFKFVDSWLCISSKSVNFHQQQILPPDIPGDQYSYIAHYRVRLLSVVSDTSHLILLLRIVLISMSTEIERQ